MKATYKILSLAIFLVGFTCKSKAGHLSSELLVTAKLTGDQEVPPVSTDAVGLASFTINESRDSVFFNISVNGLSGDITGIHIHEGEIGSSGNAVINLSPYVKGTKIMGYVPSSSIDKAFIGKLLTGSYYLNVHTKANANGEIRGQLTLETDWSFHASLDTMQQNHSVTNMAMGHAIFSVGIDGKTLTYNVVTQDLSGDITGAHLHFGAKGQDGGVAVNLSSGIDGKHLRGTADISSNTGLIESMLSGDIYLNIHTTDNPNGEIRGQVETTPGLPFDVNLSTDQQVSTVTGSAGVGTAYLSLNPTMDTLWYSVMAADLSGSISSAHIHSGAVGTDGNVMVNLSSSISGNRMVGMATGTEITSSLIKDLMTGNAYINVHTAQNPKGEIRGQIYRLAREGYTMNLTGSQEIPPALTNAHGVGIVSIDRNQSNAHFMIVVDELSGPITAAHFHNAGIGANGNVLFNLGSSFNLSKNYDGAFGYWNATSSVAFSTNNSVQFRNEEVYINVHTLAYATGELRGQADRGFAPVEMEEIDNGKLPVNPQFMGKLMYTAKLSGANEVPSVNTDATGIIGLTVSDDFTTVKLNATFSGLSSEFNGAHIHEGVAGTNGAVVADLSANINSTQISAELTSLDMEKLAKGMYYLNIHSEDYPNGELRGQLMLETESALVATISGDQEVPEVNTKANGLGVFYLANQNSELRFRVVVEGLSGEITGAHLHNAAIGSNGNVVADLTTMVQGNTIMGSLDPSTFIDELVDGDIYVNVHTNANMNGEIRGQLLIQNGFVYDAWMNGKQALPESKTTAQGLAVIKVNYGMDSLWYWTNTSGLSGDISAIHLHKGQLGISGGVELNMSAGISGTWTSGLVTGANLDAALLADLNAGNIYVNAHSLAFPTGEIRGQVFRMARDGYSFELCGDQESPKVNSTGYGSAILSIDRDNTFMHMMMVTTNFSEEVTAAHIHKGAPGSNGDVLFALDLKGSNYFAYADTFMEIDTSTFRLIKEGNAYVNLHTASNPAGEIRGQADNETDCPTAPATVGIPTLDEFGGSFYPNPASRSVTFTPGEYQGVVKIAVYNLMGEQVLPVAEVTGGKEINISQLKPGIYSVRISGNGLSSSTKLIKY